MVDYLAGDFLLINLKTSYSIGYWKAVDVSDAVKEENYPIPHFFGTSLELLTPYGVFIEIDHNRIVNNGQNANQGNRTDFNLGFKFIMGKDQR